MDLTISQMMQMQKELFEAHKEKWSPLEPEYGKDSILYMIEEIGEVIAVLKKKGHHAIADDPFVRQVFLSELADVLMFYHDVLLRYAISPAEISEAFLKKHSIDMERDYAKEYKEKYNG